MVTAPPPSLTQVGGATSCDFLSPPLSHLAMFGTMQRDPNLSQKSDIIYLAGSKHKNSEVDLCWPI